MSHAHEQFVARAYKILAKKRKKYTTKHFFVLKLMKSADVTRR